jgi:glutamate racemase
MGTDIRSRAIGVFDSGVGGISVLAELIKTLPQEDFIYLGDCLNAPYGTRDVDQVRRLTFDAVDFLLNKGIKAIVIACNTATSAAINQLRQRLDIPVIGMEPALKPAAGSNRQGSIVVMATPMTLKESKFNNLLSGYRDKAEIIPLPCPGLVELIEAGELEGDKVDRLLAELTYPLDMDNVSSVVLGCTHYPLIKDAIQKVFGDRVAVIDGNAGTARQLKRVLDGNSLIYSGRHKKGQVELHTFGCRERVIPLFRQLLKHMGIN